ncbi:MAG TPA: kelch repeat-containing protein [Verrucomicrobiae bacterium]|nr:kelch repeat-containing protein [Verrucomicrobiae bacterium]
MAPTATLLPGGKVLLPGGRDFHTYHSTNITIKAVGNRNVNRQRHTTTLLPDGKVLVVGGLWATPESSVELFDPLTKAWTEIPPMTTNREWHTATLLPSGKILVAGGRKSFPAFSSAELYDVQTQTWTPTGSMTTNRYGHTATVLPNGKVLVTGGGNTSLGGLGAELYDPITGSWTATSSMKANRLGHTATLLKNGKVLVAGGNSYDAELYDPTTEQWSAAGVTAATGFNPAAVLLPSGRVLLVGREPVAALYDPVTGLWSTTTSFNNRSGEVTATLLTTGDVLVAGAGPSSFPSAELFDPISERWTGIHIGDHWGHTATMLASGEVLILGGNGIAGPDATNLLFSPYSGISNSWRPQITFATSPLSLGSSLVVTGSQFRGVFGASKNNRDSSTDYPLVQLRSIASGQTMFLQATNWSTDSFTSLPVWNFPPGWALVTVFVNGIPSDSRIINIPVPIPTPPTIAAAKTLSNGAFQFAFANSVGATFGVLASTNASLPLTQWTALGGIVEASPGQFQFTDPHATNSPQHFYRVRAN